MCLNQQKVYCTKCKITWFHLLIDSKKYWEKKRKIHNDFQYQSSEINDNQKKVCNNFKLK